MQARYQTGRKVGAIGLLLILAHLTSACGLLAGSETIDRIGFELNASLPTVSVADTDQTKTENADFREVFFSIWPRYRP